MRSNNQSLNNSMKSIPTSHQPATIFCKPVKTTHTGELLYLGHDECRQSNISFRTLELDTDIEMLYDWVNQPYSKRFWQLNGSKTLLYNTCKSVLDNPNAHSFIGCCNEQPVCQVDLYNVAADELKDHTILEPDDCGLHLLMIPPKQSSKGLSLLMLKHFIRFYFSFPQASRLFAEPDKENTVANLLAKRVGFQFLKSIHLSYKSANLYCITKHQFNESNSIA